MGQLNIALLSYRSNPHVGGQGIYLRHLSRELAALGHRVEVFSGQPYPDLDPGVHLTKVPSLDLYAEPDPFRNPRPSEFRDLIDVEEWVRMRTGAFPEPLTFARRVVKLLRARADEFDIVHDNQTLAPPMLEIEKFGLPLITTLHHPISFDRRIELIAAKGGGWRGFKKRFGLRRWYSFVRMQAKVARRLSVVITPSESSRRDVATEFGVDLAKTKSIVLGVDDKFVPPTAPRVPGRILAMASADAPMKGISTLLEAFAKLRTERDIELVLVTKPVRGGRTEKLIDQLAIGDSVRFVSGISDAELVELMGSAELACVPSLYEGFSLPTAELMACSTPLVASRAGAIPEVTGPSGEAATLVEPGDVNELAGAIADLLDDPAKRAAYGAAGRARVDQLFSWRAVAQNMVVAYDAAIASYRKEHDADRRL
ncbi:MAG TPA: glycosyltransferase family 4 protein [Aeromicrobium sp.]|nr:glycosyltransferase family 4 protein [Aeromicrobium sp.]HKY57432.1 glycosyltransferase family 4 protein [Aeromicrobium sp.]